MTEHIHQQIVGHLLGVLDDDEHRVIDQRLEHDPACARQLALWRRRLNPLEALRPDFEPPTGLAERTCRYVGLCAAVSSEAAGRESLRKMSPSLVPPNCVAGFRWSDVAAIAILLVAAITTILPAIDSSRFHSQVAACQNGLRQLGLGLSQHGDLQKCDLCQLAENGTLTATGVSAVKLVDEFQLADIDRPACPDAWLAMQAAPVDGTVDNASLNWPGAWRDGTMHDRRPPPSPADVPLLADAPSAELPGQTVAAHGGHGRNVLYADGRTAFLPAVSPADASDWVLSALVSDGSPDASRPHLLISR